MLQIVRWAQPTNFIVEIKSLRFVLRLLRLLAANKTKALNQNTLALKNPNMVLTLIVDV